MEKRIVCAVKGCHCLATVYIRSFLVCNGCFTVLDADTKKYFSKRLEIPQDLILRFYVLSPVQQFPCNRCNRL